MTATVQRRAGAIHCPCLLRSAVVCAGEVWSQFCLVESSRLDVSLQRLLAKRSVKSAHRYGHMMLGNVVWKGYRCEL
jgi:hypothetical protein